MAGNVEAAADATEESPASENVDPAPAHELQSEAAEVSNTIMDARVILD